MLYETGVILCDVGTQQDPENREKQQSHRLESGERDTAHLCVQPAARVDISLCAVKGNLANKSFDRFVEEEL